MAGHDDHERIAADRLRHRIDRALHAHGAGDFVVGAGFAARNGAGELVDALVEVGDAGHVERDVGKIRVAAAQQRDNPFDRDFGIQRRTLLARLGIELVQPAAGIDLARFGKLHPKMPRSPHAMPHRPIAVSKIVYPYPDMTPPNPEGIIAPS